MSDMESFLHRLRQSMKLGRGTTLPRNSEEAYHVLAQVILPNQHKNLADLLESSPNVDINLQSRRTQRTLILSAASAGAYECLLILIRKGADPNIADISGNTPLIVSAKNGHKRCMRKLIECNANAETRDSSGFAAIHWIALNGREENLSIILASTADINIRDNQGHTCLHLACKNGHVKVIRVLLERSCDVNTQSVHGETALHMACKYGQIEAVSCLLEAKASYLPAGSQKRYPLDLAAEAGHSHVILKLLDTAPNLQPSLIDCLIKDLDQAKLIPCLTEVAKRRDLFEQMSTSVATLSATVGLQLLSLNSNVSTETGSLLICIQALVSLKMSANQAGKKLSLTTYKPLEALWSTLSEWCELVSRSLGSGGVNDLDSPLLSPSALLSPLLASVTSDEDGSGFVTAVEKQKESENMNDRRKPHNFSRLTPERETDVESSLGGNDNAKASLRSRASSSGDAATGMRERPISYKTAVKSSSLHPADDNGDSSAVFMTSTHSIGADFESNKPIRARAAGGSVTSHISERFPMGLGLGGSGNTPLSKVSSTASFATVTSETSGYVHATNSLQRSSSWASATRPDILSSLSRNVTSPYSATSQGKSKFELDGSIDLDLVTPRVAAVLRVFYIASSELSPPPVTAPLRRDRLGLPESPRVGMGLRRFRRFVTLYLPVIRAFVNNKPQVLFEHFYFLLEVDELTPHFVKTIKDQPFSERKKWFYKNLLTSDTSIILPGLRNSRAFEELNVSRESLFRSSCHEIMRRDPLSLKNGFSISFEGEEGVGTGLTREWFSILSEELLNPDYGLFTPSPDGLTFQPSSHSAVNPDHLNYFDFAGQIIGLALCHQQLLSVYFTRSFYKHILGMRVDYSDVASIDPEYAKNLQWILDNDIEELGLGLAFSMETDVFGAMEQIELIPGGSHVFVEEKNKRRYVQLVTELRMTRSIQKQIDGFLQGFHKYVPRSLVKLFDAYELELLLSGVPEIDVSDWKGNTVYTEYEETDPVIQWFWEVLCELPQEKRVIVLQFVTGTSRVPHGGFAHLSGGDSVQKFTISRASYTDGTLPTASTCVNLLRLPEYPTKEELLKKLNTIIDCGWLGYTRA